ncbi:hypothetical protein D7B24_003819 [Verticillium nonalfalfae]|uniref:CPAF-like PDZ domain-containing protein n=1 Tax=Verticillium nonalfalfae TaxID=1051616 RepID=A0A3M9YHB1_9PEZI|nr:uncharacterized protein D7B24_003819 [Verticillium nonalfalfae]RNJ58998.1 hypothetical protein D7B24_003819 [Verticillium nonalfalfae]
MVRPATIASGAIPFFELAARGPHIAKRQTSQNACAQLSEAYSGGSGAFNGTFGSSSPALVRPSIAYECLRSIAVDTERDIALLEYLEPWLEFQSTVGILADPPEGYMYPGVDILGGFSNMTNMLRNGDYDNQYDFIVDLFRLINVKPREGHLSYTPALISAVQFATPAVFISISEDGTSLPSIYLYDDYLQSQSQGYDAAEVVSFDGTPIFDWLQQRGVDNDRNQDPDASWNSQLYSAALDNIGVSAASTIFAHGNLTDQSTIVFGNNTEVSFNNVAVLVGDFSNISSGEDVHNRFEVPDRFGNAESSPFTKLAKRQSDGFDNVGYPDPFVIHEDGYISGYHFRRGKLDDTAVLAVKSFLTSDLESQPEADLEEFVRVVSTFVTDSADDGKDRLIIDFQGNGGGSLANLIALYLFLFPQAETFLPLRARANPLLNWMGETAVEFRAPMLPVYDLRTAVDEDMNTFSSWSDFYDLETILGDDFTQIYHPLDMSLFRQFSSLPEHFTANNTVILTDGFCASACALAVGLMSRLLGIHVVTLGGRPNERPMQAVGGTKGGPILTLDWGKAIFPDIASEERPPSDLRTAPFSEVGPPLAGPPPEMIVVNSANVHLHDDDDAAPLQFVYEAANCRLFYTWETLTNLTNLWEAVSDVKWDGASCVSGSTTNSDNTIGDSAPAFSQDYVSKFTWTPGPGDISDSPPTGPGGGGNGRSNGGGGNGNGNGNGNGGSSNGDDSDNAAGRVTGASFTVLVALAAAVIAFA